MNLKNIFKISVFTIVFISLLIVSGLFSRSQLSQDTPFPTWTYNSENKILNIFTSWDSGFFYDLATNGYQNSSSQLSKTEISITSNSWIKVFLGGVLIGNNQIPLPASESINNLVIVANPSKEPQNFSIYNAYPGIGYCIYKGPINYERDVKSFEESLSNPNSCGNTACTNSYVSVFDLSNQKIVYQESFSKNTNEKTIGENFPEFDSNLPFQGFGCNTINSENVTQETSNSYKNNYSSFAFMPLFPFIVNFLSFGIFDKVAIGLILNILFFVISSLLVFKISFEITKNKENSLLASILFLTLPGSFALVTFQAVGLFTLLFLTIIFLSLKNKHLITIPLLFLLVLTDILGLFILIPLYFLLLKKRNIFYLYTGSAILALTFQTFYLFSETNDILILLNSKIPWYSGSSNFVTGFINYFTNFDNFKFFEILYCLSLLLIMLINTKIKKNTQVLDSRYFSIMLLSMSIFNGGFTGMIKYLPLTLLPLIVNFKLNKKISYLVIILGIITNLILFALWTISSRFVV